MFVLMMPRTLTWVVVDLRPQLKLESRNQEQKQNTFSVIHSNSHAFLLEYMFKWVCVEQVCVEAVCVQQESMCVTWIPVILSVQLSNTHALHCIGVVVVPPPRFLLLLWFLEFGSLSLVPWVLEFQFQSEFKFKFQFEFLSLSLSFSLSCSGIIHSFLLLNRSMKLRIKRSKF